MVPEKQGLKHGVLPDNVVLMLGLSSGSRKTRIETETEDYVHLYSMEV